MENNLYERYAKIRDLRGLSDYKVANITKVGTPTISNWKNGKYTPKDDKMQEIANVLDVTLDYLKGNIDYVICPVCGFLDNPLSELSRKEHEVFHAKFLSVKEKYPFFMEYATANSVRTDAINDFRNPQKSLEERVAAFDNYLKADFSLEISKRNHEIDNFNYDDYCKREVLSLQTDWVITDELIDAIAEKYGVDRSFIDNNAIILERVSKDSQLLRILKYLEMLNLEARDMIEIQAEALANKNKKE